MPPFQTSRRVEGNQGVHIPCDIQEGSTRYHPSIFRGGLKGTKGFLSFYKASTKTLKKKKKYEKVGGSSYLSSFTIGNDLLIGQSNLSSTFVGLGTPSPIFPLHINFTDSGNNTITELLALERNIF